MITAPLGGPRLFRIYPKSAHPLLLRLSPIGAAYAIPTMGPRRVRQLALGCESN